MNKKILAAIAVPVIAASIAACGTKHAGAAASASASVHAFSTSSQGQKDKAEAQKIYSKCLPQQPVAQLKYAQLFIAGKNSKHAAQGKAERDALDACAGIPEGKRTAFNNAALGAGEKALEKELTHHKGSLTTYFEATLPNLVISYGG